MEKIKFLDKAHEKAFEKVCNQMHNLDCYHRAVAYLLSLDVVLRNHIQEVFDFEEDCIKCDSLQKDWQTGTSLKVVRLAYNLWNGCYYDNYIDDGSCGYYSVGEIFSAGGQYAEYYWVAIKLRFGY